MLSDAENEVVIQTSGGFLKDIEIILKNVKPNGDILHLTDDLYIDKLVSVIWRYQKLVGVNFEGLKTQGYNLASCEILSCKKLLSVIWHFI